jgi:hypothetical protein
MKLHRELAISPLELRGVGTAFDTQHFVIVSAL